jgi:hypothetical protein
MPWDNRLNTGKGRSFQLRAAEILSREFGVKFEVNFVIPIGNPPKEHQFDLVSEDFRYVGECKNYSWTEGENVPSAKMAFVNEAVLYLSLLPPDKERFIVMRRDVHPTKRESLANYYYRTYRHLLGNLYIVEIDLERASAEVIGKEK